MSQQTADAQRSGPATAGSAPSVVSVGNGLAVARLLMAAALAAALVTGVDCVIWAVRLRRAVP